MVIENKSMSVAPTASSWSIICDDCFLPTSADTATPIYIYQYTFTAFRDKTYPWEHWLTADLSRVLGRYSWS